FGEARLRVGRGGVRVRAGQDSKRDEKYERRVARRLSLGCAAALEAWGASEACRCCDAPRRRAAWPARPSPDQTRDPGRETPEACPCPCQQACSVRPACLVFSAAYSASERRRCAGWG